jgi:hypothetical protein
MDLCAELLEKENHITVHELKYMVLMKYMGYTLEECPIFGCFPCQSAMGLMMLLDNVTREYAVATSDRCTDCPLSDMKKCNSSPIEEESSMSIFGKIATLVRRMNYLYKEDNVNEFASTLLDFCFGCQQIAFRPLAKGAEEDYEIL